MSTIASPAATRHGLRGLHNRLADRLDAWIAHSLLALAARFAIAGIFFQSGRTKVDGWLKVTDNTVMLFEHEYQVPLLSPVVAAHMATYAEHLFPLLLALGLFTRFSALSLLIMTAVIQIFVYPSAWPTHLAWAGLMLYLLGRGAGPLSLDRAVGLR